MERIDRVEEDLRDAVVKLSLMNGERSKAPTLQDNELAAVECVKNGNRTFLPVLLETGVENDLLIVEQEIYNLQNEITIIDFDLELLFEQKEILSSYFRKLDDSENPKQLKEQTYIQFINPIKTITDKAVKKELQEFSFNQSLFRLLKLEIPDPMKIGSKHSLHFAQCSVALDKFKYAQLQPAIEVKIIELVERRVTINAELKDYRLIQNKIDSEYLRLCEKQAQDYLVLLDKFDSKLPINYQVNERVMELILQCKVSPSYQDEATGNTLLHIALEREDIEIVKLLIDRRADPLLKNKSGETALECAAKKEKPAFLEAVAEGLKKSDFLDQQLRLVWIHQLQEMLKPLIEAKEHLDTYAATLVYRKNIFTFLRMLLCIEKRMGSRTKEFNLYYQQLNSAGEDLDPRIFFDTVEQLSKSAERGLLRQSSLHGVLVEIRERFYAKFDAHKFNRLKEAHYASVGSPLIRRNAVDSNAIHKENTILKEENSSLKIQLTSALSRLEEASEKTPRSVTPRRGDDSEKAAPPASSSPKFFS